MIEEINPILRGWVHYFAYGHSSRCFCYVQCWVEREDSTPPGEGLAGAEASAGNDGVGSGSMMHWGCLPIIECVIGRRDWKVVPV